MSSLPEPLSSYILEPQPDPQSSYIPAEPQSDQYILEPPSSSHRTYSPSHAHNASSSSSSSSTPGLTHHRRHSSPNSPLSPDVPLPRTVARRSPNQRFLALPDDNDSSDDEPLSPNATEKERAEWRKRRNTKAARRSRKRKVQYTEQLEAIVEKLQREKDMWRTRALTLSQLLKGHNIPSPTFED